MIRKIYKRISDAILRRRYRRLYYRLFWHYAQKSTSAAVACNEASLAFEYATGTPWLEWLFSAYPTKK